jgi:hypothetical protein
MVRKFQVNDQVLVPSSVIGRDDLAYAVFPTTVREVHGRSVVVDLPNRGGLSGRIGTRRVHDSISILVLAIGDFVTEETLILPLHKSVLQFFRLLVEDPVIKRLFIRHVDELRTFWRANGAAYSHVVMIGHGSPTGITFGAGGESSAADVAGAFADHGPKVFVSLCCNTGIASFARPFSSAPECECIIAPFNRVHGAEASHFCQTLFSDVLLNGSTTKTAYNRARAQTVHPRGAFRFWRRGQMKSVPN